MKRCFAPLLFLIFIIYSCTKKDFNPLVNTISKEKAVEDINTCVKILKQVHPALYLYISEKRFNQLADSLKSTVKEDITVGELYNMLNYMADETGCSHTVLQLPGYMYDTLQNRKFFFPYSVKLIEGRLYVNSYKYDLPERTEIKSINGHPVQKILNELMFLERVEGRHRNTQKELAASDFAFDYFLKYGAAKEFVINITDTNGRAATVTEQAITKQEWDERDYNYQYYFDGKDVDYDLYINDEKNYAYMRIYTFKYEGGERQTAYENFCNNSFQLLKAKKVKSLIIDVRENTGGELYNLFYLFSYLSPKPFREYEKVVSRINSIPFPALLDKEFKDASMKAVNERLEEEFAPSLNKNYYILADSLIQTWEPDLNRFNGNVFVITNPKVASSASYFSVMVKNSGAGKVVGEETAGGACSGNGFTNLEYTLPNSEIKLILPYAHIIYTFKDAVNKGQGVLPDFFVPDKKTSFTENKDGQYSFITDSIINKLKP